jgi:hypothetical protein
VALDRFCRTHRPSFHRAYRFHRRQRAHNCSAGCRTATRAGGAALRSIAALGVETISRAASPCTKWYLKEQGQIVENCVGYIERLVDRGMSPEEILNRPLEVAKRDPYPIGQRPSLQNEG